MKFLVLLLLTGCATSESKIQQAEYSCPATVWLIPEHVPADSELDTRTEKTAKLGCIRKYGEGACLVSLRKTSKDSYWAICRRK